MDLISNYGDQYKFCLPYLGEFHEIIAYLKTVYKKHGSYFLAEMGKKCGFKGATLHKILTVKNYRASLNFLLAAMESVIFLQLKMFSDFHNNEFGCVPPVLEDLQNLDWQNCSDKESLGNYF